MKLFVTGGTGFIGTHFLVQALQAGHEVRALRRPGSQPRLPLPSQPEWVDGALDGDLQAQLAGCEVLVHLAAHTPNPPYAPLDACLYWNVVAPLRLAQQAWAAGVQRFLVAGSCFEYGRAAERVAAVDAWTPLEPALSYPTSKAAASIAFEGFAREQGARLKLLRIFQVFGDGEPAGRFWPALQRAAECGADFPMSTGDQVRDFVSVHDVATAIVRHLDFDTVQPGAPEVHPIASGHPQSLLEFASHWWRHWGATGRLLPGALPRRPGEVMRLAPRLDFHRLPADR